MKCPKCDSTGWLRMGSIIECGSCGFRVDELYNFRHFSRNKFIE